MVHTYSMKHKLGEKKGLESKYTFFDLKPERGFKLEYHQTKSCKVETNSAGWRESVHWEFVSIFIQVLFPYLL